MKAARVAFFLALVVGALLGASSVASACQCGTKPPADVALAQSEVVVAGVVTTIEPTSTHTDGFAQAFPVASRIRVKVQKQWKGVAATELVLTASSTCAFTFQVGRAYLVFASSYGHPAGELEASKCFPNKLYAKAASELALLGPPIPRK